MILEPRTKAFCLFFLAGAAIAQDGKLKITIKPKVGETANYRSTQTQKQVVEAMGQDTTNEIVTDLQVRVDEIGSDGTVKATATWLRLRGKLQGMGGEMEFDTKKPDAGEENPMFEGFAEGCQAIVGVKTPLTFSADGKLSDRKPLEELVAKGTAKVSGMAKMMVQGIFGVHVLEEQVSVFGLFSTEPVAVGGTWTDKRDRKVRGGIDMTTEITSKLVTANDEGYEVTATGTLASASAKADDKTQAKDDEDDDEHANMMRNMMREAKIKDGKVEGTAKVARKDGFLVASLATASMAIHMPNPMGGDEPFVVTVKQTHKVERVAADAGGEAPAPLKK